MMNTRIVEEKMSRLFSVKKPFSEHLSKWEDALLPDKYDHNGFEYSAQPSREEFNKALAYQKRIGADFIKLEGDAPLEDAFGLEQSITVTMVLQKQDVQWKTNNTLCFHSPSLSEIEAIELKHFGPLYGEDFTVRNVRRIFEKLTYHGAYVGDHLVGACYSYTTDGMTCIDGLIVDEQYRHQYVATSLLGYVRMLCPDTVLFLHADLDETPKDMYLKMGFEITDYLYEYLRQDITNS